jgi:Tfp pilus assembly pilus retraction ATPase PilT
VLDLRISTIPTPFGESVVIRILPTQMLFNLEKLGLAKRDLQILESLILKPHGIIFVTGPTGSGKTTSLYACLSRINTKDRKIITIEDPIEYEMSGITQIQVMPEIGLDFARGLRSILRHDPDVIMVGEVRDLETAEIAIRVALTGHLVFSTLHTNDAASGITRLIDIGVEPYLVASSVEAFIAQRLIRVICPECKYEDNKVPPALKELIAGELGVKAAEVKISRGKGCPNCNFTGFFGRTAIYEILLIDEAIKDLVLKKTTSSQIKKIAVSHGMRTLRQDGWQKTISGMTTPEEVMKVTSIEEQIDIEKNPQVSRAEPSEDDILKPSQFDKRAYTRLSCEANLRYKVFKSQQDLIKRGFSPEQLSVTKDVSAGGLLFVSNEPVPIGSILELKIELPDSKEPIECLARVVRIEEREADQNYNIAVCFLDITGAQKARMNKYVKTELTK